VVGKQPDATRRHGSGQTAAATAGTWPAIFEIISRRAESTRMDNGVTALLLNSFRETLFSRR
jgi:hypothetical protein